MAKRVLMEGNEAIAEAAIRAGCHAYFGYPITPQNELIGYMAEHMPAHKRVFIQAESEIAAINMVYGAAAAGGRAMTSSSSPGISLKQEGISYMVGAELPGVIVNIVRGGPGLGNISPAQSDYYQSTRGGGHGDYRTPALAPDSVQEAVDLTMIAFDIADTYRTPVLIVGDAIIGQIKEPVVLPPYRKLPSLTKKSWAVGPNLGKGAVGRPTRQVSSIYLKKGGLEEVNVKLAEKYRQIEKNETRYEEVDTRGADILIVAYGTSARIVKGALPMAKEAGLKVGLLRPITIWPFPSKRIQQLAQRTKVVLAVEMSMGQMVDDVRLAVNGCTPVDLHARAGGGIPSCEDILAHVKKLTRKYGKK